jgi:DNA modification methylase
MSDIWVSIVPAKTEEERIEIALSDNDRAGKYEADMLADLTGSFPNIDWKQYSVDLDDPVNMKEFMERFDTTREDTSPEVQENPISKPGEMYTLGNHRLLCGDATSADDMKKLMGDRKAPMVFTDPPYNVNYEGGGGQKREGIMNDEMPSEQFYEFLHKALSNMVSSTDGVFYVCMSPKELGQLKKAFESAGGHWQSYVIWVKNRFTLGGSDYQPQYEPILYGWTKDLKNHFFVDDRSQGNVWYDLGGRAKYENGKTYINVGGIRLELDGKVTGKVLKGKRKTDVWEYDRPTASKEHPTMKPIKLITEAIKNSSMPGDLILDPFLVSGSTMIAAEQTGRICYGMELDPKYCDVIRKRWWKYMNNDEEDGWEQATKAL